MPRLAGALSNDSRALAHVFQSHIERPENTVRRQRRVGGIALRDNHTTQHYGVDGSDAHDSEVPVGVDRGGPCGVTVLADPAVASDGPPHLPLRHALFLGRLAGEEPGAVVEVPYATPAGPEW
ncbi:hypothetical protein ACFYZ8_14155 [Streptomyces sp. NPDC001668]|uniref:hypothetical protein n=1 Tax=unclassified Streptomyces TaxID=2593676 RepID=UPI0036CB70F1